MSAKYEMVKKFYDKGDWSKGQVKNAVKKGLITKDEYEQITGEKYR